MDNDLWTSKYNEAILWVEGLYAKDYTAIQSKNMSEILRNVIPPLRIMKVFKYACEQHKFSNLPNHKDYLKAQREAPYSQITLEKHEAVCEKCTGGWINWKMQCLDGKMRPQYALCKCWKGQRIANSFDKTEMEFFEDIPIMAEEIQAGNIIFTGGHPVDSQSGMVLWMEETDLGMRIMSEDRQTEIVIDSIKTLDEEGGYFAEVGKRLAARCGIEQVEA